MPEVNSGPDFPTPATPYSKNGGILRGSEESPGVGGVGGCSSDVGASYTQNGQAAQGVEPFGVGSVGEKPPEFMPRRRVVI